jgi:putative endonuclease
MGETLLKNQLLNKGWIFISQNFYTRFGEIDLIFIDPDNTLVFIEVKTRSSNNLGFPEEAVNSRKIANIRKSAEIFITKNPKYQNYLLRIDVAAIQNQNIRYYKNIT